MRPKTRADEQRDDAADQEIEADRPERAAAADPEPRGDQGDARGERDQQRLQDQLELRDAEVELALEDREARQEAAAIERSDAAGRPATIGSREMRRRCGRPLPFDGSAPVSWHALLEQDRRRRAA